MADPYWRYASASAARQSVLPPEKSENGNVPNSSFPGYLSSEASRLTSYDAYNSNDHPVLSTRLGDHSSNDMASVRSEHGASGVTAGAGSKSNMPSFEDPSPLRHRPDVVSGHTSGFPDETYDRPNYLRRPDGPPVPTGQSNILFVDGLPTDCTRREIGHLFRPFIGFIELRVIHKEPRRRGDKAMVLCFVEFTDAKCAVTAMEALQGYKFDDKKTDSHTLKIHFAHFPFRLPSDGEVPRAGGVR